MFGISANYKNECSKLFSGKKYFVFMAIEVVICIIAASSKVLSAKITGGMWSMSGINMSMTLMSLFLEAVIPFILIMASCDLFSVEFQEKTIRSVFMRPTARYKVFAGKFLAVTTLGIINMAVVFFASTALDMMVSGSVSGIGYAISAYCVDIIPMMVLVLMSIFINQLVKSSTLAMFLCIIVYVALKFLGIYYPWLSGLVFTGYMQWHKVWLGSVLPVAAVMKKAMLLFGYGLTFTAVGYYMFRFKEC